MLFHKTRLVSRRNHKGSSELSQWECLNDKENIHKT